MTSPVNWGPYRTTSENGCENSAKQRGSGAQLWNCSQQIQPLFPAKNASYSKRSPVSYADLSKQRDSNLHCHQNTRRVRAERRTFPQSSKGSSSIQTRHTELKKMNLCADFFPKWTFQIYRNPPCHIQRTTLLAVSHAEGLLFQAP